METSDARYHRYRRALRAEDLPAALVDLDAFERNLAAVRARVEGTRVSVRLGTKSVRCVALVKRALKLLGERAGGLLAFTAREAEALGERGFGDLLVAYPSARPGDAGRYAALARHGMEVRATADTVEHLGPLALAARDAGATIPVVVDVDMGWRPPLAPEALVLGVRRSPLWEPSRVVALAREVQRTRGLRFAGLLAYEAQLAGLGDRDRHGRAVPTHVLVKALSRPQVRARRRAVCEALVAAGLVPALVNGGGTGSLSYSARDPSVTEVTVGSALLGGTLFDGMTDLAPEPALYFALEVTRAPAEALVTCLGGGYIASGAAGPDRLPSPTLPEGLSLLAREGAGEVQTPLKVRAGLRLLPGDPVFFRHAKSGELAERFASYLLVRGDQVVERVPTYRGEGWCFL